MADGVRIPATGTGDATPTIATDDTGASGQVQIVKLATATNGSATMIEPASSDKQDTGNISLSSINTKTPNLGQAATGASVPVVLPASQITTLTPPAAITNYALETGGNLATIAAKDFATQTTLAAIKAKTDNIDVALSTRTKPADAQHVIVDSGVTTGLTDTQLRASPVPVSGTVTANAGTNLNTSALALDTTMSTTNTEIGGLTETAPVSDTASSGLNGRLQRIAQRLTSMIALLPASLGQKTKANSLAVTLASDQDTLPVSLTSTTITGTVTVDDLAAAPTGAAVPANAQYQGNLAQTALPSAATSGNLTGALADKFGRTIMIPGTLRDLVGTQPTTISASTAETTVVAAAASTFNDLTAIVISNTSATAARVDFRDTTAGSVLFSIYVPAGDVRGATFNRPVPQTSVNTNWTAQSSASITDLRIYCVFDKNK